MSEDFEHQQNQEKLRNYFQKIYANFFDNVIYEKFGRILTIEKARKKIIFKKIPDLMVIERKKNLYGLEKQKVIVISIRMGI